MPISRILCPAKGGTIVIYLGLALLLDSSDSDSDAKSENTVLHSRKDFAVSAGLNRVISVLTSMVTHDGRYPLRLIRHICPMGHMSPIGMFGLSSSNLLETTSNPDEAKPVEIPTPHGVGTIQHPQAL